MAHPMIVQNFNLPGSISCKFALEWSTENKIAISTSKGVYILSSYCSPIETGFPLPLHKQVIPIPTKPLDFNIFGDIPMRNIGFSCPDPLYQVMLDHTLMSPKETQFLGYRCAKWSPEGANGDGSCLLATLTLDHRLVLHREKDREWEPVCDLSEMLFDIHKSSWKGAVATDEDDEDDSSFEDDEEFASFRRTEVLDIGKVLPEISNLKERAYNLSAVEITWTNVFTTAAPSVNECGNRWCYLIVAMKSGHVVWWKVSPDDPKMVSLAFEWDTKLGTITALRWQQTTTNSGFLVIGTLMGLLTFTPVSVRLCGTEPQLVIKPICKLWSESDRIMVDSIAVMKVNLKKHVIVAAKQNFLISCEVSLTESDTLIKNIGHSVGLHQLPVTGLTVMNEVMPQTHILLSSMEGLLIDVKVNVGQKGIEFHHEPLQLDIDVKHNMFQGLGTSPNGILGAAILNTSVYFDHLVKREPLQFVMFTTKPLEEIFLEFSRVLKPQFSFLPSVASNISKYIDYLECVRIQLANNDVIPDLFRSLINWTIESYERLSCMELHFIRFLLKCFLSELAVNVPFEKQDLVNKLDAIETVIMRNYISKVVSSCHDKIDLLSPAQGQSLLLMADWLYMQFETPVSHLYEAFGYDCPTNVSTIPPRETCRICQLPVKLENIRYGECEQKHKFGRCCQSLILCDMTPYYQCLSCKSVALEDVWSSKFICTYCSLPMTR